MEPSQPFEHLRPLDAESPAPSPPLIAPDPSPAAPAVPPPPQFTLRTMFSLMVFAAFLFIGGWIPVLIVTPPILFVVGCLRWIESRPSLSWFLGSLAFPVLACLGFPFIEDYAHRQRAKGHAWAMRLNGAKQIALALHMYEAQYGVLPPPYLADAQGKPMHSWRVLILPYIEGNHIYKQYRFDEPWDGPNNTKLHGQISSFYISTYGPATTNTAYLAITGPGTAWDPAVPRKLTDFPDGAHQTLLLLEVRNSGIHWLDPRDLPANGVLLTIQQGAKMNQKPGCIAAFVDGSVDLVPDTLTPAEVRALVTPDGNDNPPSLP